MAQSKAVSTKGHVTILGSDTRVHGRVTGEGDIVIDGTVEGDITVSGHVTIGEHGKVGGGSVDGHDVTVEGTIEGEVRASGLVHIGSGAKVRGDLSGATIGIDEGASFAGRIECDVELPAQLR